MLEILFLELYFILVIENRFKMFFPPSFPYFYPDLTAVRIMSGLKWQSIIVRYDHNLSKARLSLSSKIEFLGSGYQNKKHHYC